MFKTIRAISRGNKVARETVELSKNIINGSILAGCQIMTRDTAGIVRESFAFCCTMSVQSWMGDLQRGAMANHALGIVLDSLKKEWSKPEYFAADPEWDPEIVSTFENGFTERMSEWLNELVSVIPEIHGKDEISPYAVDKLATDISCYLVSRFGDEASELEEEIRAYAQLSLERLK